MVPPSLRGRPIVLTRTRRAGPLRSRPLRPRHGRHSPLTAGSLLPILPPSAWRTRGGSLCACPPCSRSSATFSGSKRRRPPAPSRPIGGVFKDYESFGMKQIGGTVLVAHFTADQQHPGSVGYARQLRQVGGAAGQDRSEPGGRVDAAAPQGTAATGTPVGHGGAFARAVYGLARKGPLGPHVLWGTPP